MNAGRVPEDRTSGLTGGPQPRADGPGTDPAPGRRPSRLQALAGLTVRGSDDRTVGRVRDIYQQDASGALAAITVMPRQLSARTVLIPAAALEDLPLLAAPQDPARTGAPTEMRSGTPTGTRSDAPAETRPGAPTGAGHGEDPVVHLRVDAATARAGVRPPETAHVTPQDLREAAEALGLEPDEPGDRGAAPDADGPMSAGAPAPSEPEADRT